MSDDNVVPFAPKDVRDARAGEVPNAITELLNAVGPGGDSVPVELAGGDIIQVTPGDIEELLTYQACPDQLRLLAYRYGQLCRFRQLNNPEAPMVVLDRQRALIRQSLADALAFITAVIITEFNDLASQDIRVGAQEGITDDEHDN